MASQLPDDLIDVHRRYNRNSDGCWQDFASHRTRQTELALQAGGGRLAVLGAGNCNDLDLPALAERFREIHLVDLDREALERALGRQPPEVQQALVLHAPVDVTGALEKLATFRRE